MSIADQDRLEEPPRESVALHSVGLVAGGTTDVEGVGIHLEVVKHTEVKRGFVWITRFSWLARDYERLPDTITGLHFVAFACLMLHRLVLVTTARA